MQARRAGEHVPAPAVVDATAAAAAVTVLKWFFDDSFVIPNPLKDPRHLCSLYTQQRPELGGHFR
ncbi:MAG: hypothetical protein ACLQF1_21990, partial [Methyloceanibacter sp.]